MIIKSMARKAPTFGQLISYIGREAGEDESAFAHNLYHSGENDRLVEMQFRENYKKLEARKNGNALYHEIIALEPQPHLKPHEVAERLYWIALYYCEIRAEGQLAWGKVHHDTDFPHVHLMISSNKAQCSKRVRLSRKEFAEIQKLTERMVNRHFPELKNEAVYDRASHAKDPSRFGSTLRRVEGEMIRRTGKPSKKQEVAREVKSLMDRSADLGQLQMQLDQLGFSLHQRGSHHVLEEKNTGRRYRLKTLGLDRDMETILSKIRPEPAKPSPIQHKEASDATPQPSNAKDPRVAELEALAQRRLHDFEREDLDR